jgi:hypothetical protein
MSAVGPLPVFEPHQNFPRATHRAVAGQASRPVLLRTLSNLGIGDQAYHPASPGAAAWSTSPRPKISSATTPPSRDEQTASVKDHARQHSERGSISCQADWTICNTGRRSRTTVLHGGFETAYAVKSVVARTRTVRCKTFRNKTPNAERLAKHREGVAMRLKRIEVALEDLRDAIESVLAERRRNDPEQDAHQ